MMMSVIIVIMFMIIYEGMKVEFQEENVQKDVIM